MPTRILRDGILESERVDALSVDAELFYRRLMSRVDDFGRYTADPILLRANCYPRRVDKITTDQITEWLSECVVGDDPLILVYRVKGKKYLQIQNFNQRVRQSESKYPPPPEEGRILPFADNGGNPRRSADNGGGVRTMAARARGRSESESESESEAAAETSADARFPLAAAAVREFFPASDAELFAQIVKRVLEIMPDITDQVFVEAIIEARRQKPNQREATLFLKTVPEVTRSRLQRLRSPPPKNGHAPVAIAEAERILADPAAAATDRKLAEEFLKGTAQ